MNDRFACRRLAALPLALAAILPSASFAQAALKPTTVTATRFPEDARSLPFGVGVITSQDIERAGAVTVNDALIRVLGLPGRADLFGGGDYAIDLRGFGATADQNQVVILDGLRLTEADLGGTRLAGIPIESVERIEVIRGNASVLYGEGASAGAIVITTKAGLGKARPNGGSVYAGAGSYGLRNLRANANLGTGGFTLDASGEKREARNHRDNFRSDYEGASMTAQWAGDAVRVGLRLAEDHLDTGLPGALSAAQYAANPRQANTPQDNASLRNSRIALFAQADVRDWLLSFDIGQREKSVRSLNISPFGQVRFDYDTQATNSSLSARNTTRIGNVRNQLVLGIDSAHWTRDVLGAFPTLGTQATLGLHARDDVTLAGGTRLFAGVRTERLRKNFENGFAPAALRDRLRAWELGASQPVSETVTVFGRAGRGFRLGSVDEFSFTAPGTQLLPQTSKDVELGARWVRGADKLEARVFHSKLDNEIGFDLGIPPFGANVNFAATRREGIELEAAHQVTRDVALRANATLRKATFRAGPYAGRDIPLVPRKVLSLRADWAVAQDQRVTGGVQWVGEQHPDYPNACTMPSYATVDARYAYTVRNTELSLTGSNLLDKRFFTQAFGCAAGVTAGIFPEPGRALTAAVRVKF
jgi:iron complex outermembrane receptor protein